MIYGGSWKWKLEQRNFLSGIGVWLKDLNNEIKKLLKFCVISFAFFVTLEQNIQGIETEIKFLEYNNEHFRYAVTICNQQTWILGRNSIIATELCLPFYHRTIKKLYAI